MLNSNLKPRNLRWLDQYRQAVHGSSIYCIPFSEINARIDILSRDERQAVMRKSQEYDRIIHLKSHVAKRLTIALITDVPPEKLTFERSSSGKPYLATSFPLYFSLSHSYEYVAIAISRSVIGIDIERIDTFSEYMEIAQVYFTEAECYELKKAVEPLRTFYRMWTAKEAAIKCLDISINEFNRQATGPPVESIIAPRGYMGAVAWR